jgi:hypothetical protein
MSDRGIPDWSRERCPTSQSWSRENGRNQRAWERMSTLPAPQLARSNHFQPRSQRCRGRQATLITARFCRRGLGQNGALKRKIGGCPKKETAHMRNCAKKSRLSTRLLTACQSYEKSNRKAERLRLTDGAVHHLTTLNGGKAGVNRHVDAVIEELHRSIAQQEQTPVRMIAAEVRET